MARPSDPPIPTLGQLAAVFEWTWLNCSGCGHRRAVKFAPILERYGAGAASDMLRANAVCTACGHKGATLTMPSHVDNESGYAPFPEDER